MLFSFELSMKNCIISGSTRVGPDAKCKTHAFINSSALYIQTVKTLTRYEFKTSRECSGELTQITRLSVCISFLL